MPKKNKPSSISNRTKIISILATLLALSIAGYFGLNAYLDYIDKQRFETVKDSVGELSKKLQSKSETQWNLEASCSEGSVKFQESKKGCRIQTSSDIPVGSSKDATETIKKYGEIFRDNKNLFTAKNNYSASPADFPAGLKAGSSGEGFTENKTNMICGSLFEIKNKSVMNQGEVTLKVLFVCNDQARKLHYPRNDI